MFSLCHNITCIQWQNLLTKCKVKFSHQKFIKERNENGNYTHNYTRTSASLISSRILIRHNRKKPITKFI